MKTLFAGIKRGIKSILFKTLAVALLLVVVVFVQWGCASMRGVVEEVIEPLDIHVSEIEGVEVSYGYPLNSFLHFHIIKAKRAVVIAQIWMPDATIVRYAYLDRGEVVGFGIEESTYTATGEKKYYPDTLNADEIIYIKQVLANVDAGKKYPFDITPAQNL